MTPQPQPPDQYKEFVQHFTKEARRIFSYILTLVANYDHAEEIFQETSGTLWEKFSEFEPGTNFGAWACRIAYYKTLNFRTRRRDSPVLFSDELVESIDQQLAGGSDELDQRHRALAACFEKLSNGDRQVVDWRYAAGQSAEQIAELLGQSRATVYRTIARIHSKLLKCIEHRMSEGDA